HRRRRQFFEQNPADMLHRTHESATTRASAEVGGDLIALSVKRASCERQERDVRRVMLGRHHISPKGRATKLSPTANAI
ncbi:MAG: hypothetical protein WBW73_21375, partial [Rhodoplanes sp.]